MMLYMVMNAYVETCLVVSVAVSEYDIQNDSV
jgi:hypothetical protein